MLGVTRYYAAAQAMARVERVIRVQRRAGINAQMLAITEDGRKYRIDLVQTVQDVFPPSLDLTLSSVTHNAEVKPDAMV
jgi:acetolactate synthase regulatory subunit